MEIKLTHEIDGENKLYRGEVRIPKFSVSKDLYFETLIMAGNSEEAMDKLKKLFTQENPSADMTLCETRVFIEYFAL